MPKSHNQRNLSNKFARKVTKRGTKEEKEVEPARKPALSPYVLYFFMFILFGSTIFQLIQTLTSGPVV